MVAEEEDEGQQRRLVTVLLERATDAIVDRLQEGLQQQQEKDKEMRMGYAPPLTISMAPTRPSCSCGSTLNVLWSLWHLT